MALPFLDQQAPAMAAPQVNPTNPAASGGPWKQFLASPENRAMILQTGISLLTGTTGGNLFSEIGGALGSGMEAKDRVLTNEMQQNELGADNARADSQLALATKSAEANIANDKAQLGISQQNANTSRINANTSKENAGGSGSVEERANRTAWMKFVVSRLDPEALQVTGGVPPTIQDLAAEWQGVGGVLPSTVGQVNQPMAAPAATAATKTINGKLFSWDAGANRWKLEKKVK